MRIRTLSLAVAALAIPASLLASGVSSADTAVSGAKVFTGSIKGPVTGAIKLSPPITNTASTGPVTFTTTATFSKVNGSKTQGGVTITGAKYVSTTTLPKGTSCSTLESGTIPVGTGKLTYTATGGTVTPSSITFKSGTLANTNPITVDLNKGLTTGSFATPSATKGVLIIDQTLSKLLAQCGGTGIKSLSFTGVNGQSTFVVG